MVSSDLVETVFQKCKDGLTTLDLRECYRSACANNIPCLVTYLNKLGCESFIDSSLVEEIMIAWPRITRDPNPNYQDKRETLLDMPKKRTWTDQEMKSFIHIAIKRDFLDVVQVLIPLASRIAIEQFSVFHMDEKTCIEILHKQGYRDQENLRHAFDRGISMNMNKLTKEILKQGLILRPSFLKDRRFEIMEILIQQYPWTLEELHEIQTNVTEPRSRRLLRNEIEKRIKKNCNNPDSPSYSENDANANVKK